MWLIGYLIECLNFTIHSKLHDNYANYISAIIAMPACHAKECLWSKNWSGSHTNKLVGQHLSTRPMMKIRKKFALRMFYTSKASSIPWEFFADVSAYSIPFPSAKARDSYKIEGWTNAEDGINRKKTSSKTSRLLWRSHLFPGSSSCICSAHIIMVVYHTDKK